MSANVTADLLRSLIEHMSGADDDWESLAMILDFHDDGFTGAHGYAYPSGGRIYAVASHPRQVQPAVKAYTDSYYKPGEALPVAILVQLDRASGKYEVTFEDQDASRWKVTSRNFKELREELRPKFG